MSINVQDIQRKIEERIPLTQEEWDWIPTAWEGFAIKPEHVIERDTLLQRLAEKDREIVRLRGLVKEAAELILQTGLDWYEDKKQWLEKAKGVV